MIYLCVLDRKFYACIDSLDKLVAVQTKTLRVETARVCVAVCRLLYSFLRNHRMHGLKPNPILRRELKLGVSCNPVVKMQKPLRPPCSRAIHSILQRARF